MITFNERYRLIKTNPIKQAKILFGFRVLTFLSPKKARIIRTSYLFVKILDDIADGDYMDKDSLPFENKTYLAYVYESIMHNKPFMPNNIYKFYVYSYCNISKYVPLHVLIESWKITIESMLFDAGRKNFNGMKFYTKNEINLYYIKSYYPSLYLMMILYDKKPSKKVIKLLTNISICMGRVFSLRDREIDFKKNIINFTKKDYEEILEREHIFINILYQKEKNNINNNINKLKTVCNIKTRFIFSLLKLYLDRIISNEIRGYKK